MNNLEIKKIRKELRLTQDSFAKLLNVSKSLVQKWESGERTPDSFNIENILKLQKSTLNYSRKEDNTSTTKEPTSIYETGFDKKIAETRIEIEKVKQEIAVWEEKIKEKPNNKEEYEKYIANYEKQIFLLNEIINITLEAKRDFLESQNESENE